MIKEHFWDNSLQFVANAYKDNMIKLMRLYILTSYYCRLYRSYTVSWFKQLNCKLFKQ